MSDHVWYAGYGSNLSRERFMAYILGGKAPGASFPQVGCSDPSPPLAERRILLLHRLYFAHASPQWQDGGVAFVRRSREEGAKTLGRMYLISRRQFREIALQENGLRDYEVDGDVDLHLIEKEGQVRFWDGLYGTLLHLGEEGGYPIVTFTATWEDDQAPLNPPGPQYLRTIVRGLKDSYPISSDAVAEYLLGAPGVAGSIPESELRSLVSSL
jgi:hypothetical protein